MRNIFCAVIIISIFFNSCNLPFGDKNSRIKRFELVSRHNINLTKPEKKGVLSVGNGEIAFNFDITGLQTFPDFYTEYPLTTMAQWAWHVYPNLNRYTFNDVSEEYVIRGKKQIYPSVGYPDTSNNPASRYFNANPHKFNLAKIGLYYMRNDSLPFSISDIQNINQKLELWHGIAYSNYTIENNEVKVKTYCQPKQDVIHIELQSECLQNQKMGLNLSFPYADAGSKDGSDWDAPEKHQTILIIQNKKNCLFIRKLDTTAYRVVLKSSEPIEIEKTNNHQFKVLTSGHNTTAHFSLYFTQSSNAQTTDNFNTAEEETKAYWKYFWNNGGAVDFSGSTDPRAHELERRVVLSQYLTAINCSGSLPPQESGLAHNSWYGKFHLEMHWWHAAHFALWNRTPMLEKSLDWYTNYLEDAKNLARRYGNSGARWPKMIGPEGRESPNKINPFILWQQPHIIYLSELIYRSNPSDTVLEKYKNLVFETAEFLADFAFWDEKEKRYFIGPPVQPMEELHAAELNFNPTCELSYWQFGLKTAQIWKERLSLERNKKWEDVMNHLSPLHTVDYYGTELYSSGESSGQKVWEDCNLREQHPSFLWAKGILPGDMVNDSIMENTLQKTVTTWNFDKIWGWDPPMMAMSATRLENPDLAMDLLFQRSQNNNYAINGHCKQWSEIPSYLPANGGLLTAIALMTAGWDGCSTKLPGIPKNETWKVKFENIEKLP